MPLPGDSTLSLNFHSNPGDARPSKTKQAMLVRMSAETLEALESFQNRPKMDVVFGDNPGIYIGETFFSMRHAQESTPHELYLRTSSASKPMAPLKLYANVTGKFQVERELGAKVQEKLRESTMAAEKQRTGRGVLVLDKPPELSKSVPKKKQVQSSMFRRPIAAPDSHRTVSTSSTSQPTKVSSPRDLAIPSSLPTRVASPVPAASRNFEHTMSTRRRLVHCVAIRARTTPEVVKLVGGSDCDPGTRKEILDLLEVVAERAPAPKNSADAPVWQLRPTSWTEVRPYKWPSLSDGERTRLARQARIAFSALKIPETDPVWDHARPRDLEAASASVGQSGSSKSESTAGTFDSAVRPEAKRGIMTKETKQKKSKSDSTKKSGDIIIAKDESMKPAKAAVSKGKEKEKASDSTSTSASASKPPPVRKPPGSGFKVKASSTTPIARDSSPATTQPNKKTGPIDVRNRREPPHPSGSAKPAPPIPPPRTTQVSKSSASTTSSTVRPQKKVKAPSPLVNEVSVDEEPLRTKTVKRKKVKEESGDQELDEFVSASAPKRRKIDNERPKEKERGSEKDRDREGSVVQKKTVKREASPLPAPRTKIKKEASPLPFAQSPRPARSPLPASRLSASDVAPPPSSSSSSSISRSDDAPRHGSSKARRRSPVFTSSEDEGTKRKATYKPRFHARPLPLDNAGLRKYYKTCYSVYISLFSMKANFVMKSSERLQNSSDDSVSLSDSDSEDNMPLADPDVARAFAADLSAVERELKKIREVLAERQETMSPAVPVA
ncbi:uncharacterized protein FIBRA_00658 [Fibroporia radiculosa]|uniref:RNA polymerase II elongation factor ELL N-terminal domain-containing protein n=1 Tax=Fibroporia radiculosa TaxID=599839 RepID=J4I822_9APHY|nr:uncharacterized protein FIBRA_00658 [Fibroporia radiculosa]CCL98656.1 predicted protein [Fibroporia radiculosa]